MSQSTFASKKLAARKAAERAAAEAEAKKVAEAQRRDQIKAERAAEDAARAERLRQQAPQLFAEGFMAAAPSIVRPKWSESFIDLIEAHALSLVDVNDPAEPLEPIASEHMNALLEKFQRGLTIAIQKGRPVPDGHFYGQRLLAEKAANEPAKEQKFVIKPGSRPRSTQRGNVVHTSTTPPKAFHTGKKVGDRAA